MGFAVVVDSTADLLPEEYKALDVHMVPLSVLIDGETFKDQFEISSEQFYERMAAAENLPQSSQPTPYDLYTVPMMRQMLLQFTLQVFCLARSSLLVLLLNRLISTFVFLMVLVQALPLLWHWL